MDELIMRNIRCFAAPSIAVIKPLTLVVGDNSAGKSTLLACTRLAWDAAYGIQQLDFNEEPFRFGAFDQIAHVYGGKKGRARSFTLGSREMVVLDVQNPAGTKYCVHREIELARRGAEPVLLRNQLIVD